MISSVIKLFLPVAFAFLFGVAITPWLSKFLYTNKLWKRFARKEEHSDEACDKMSPAFKALAETTNELHTPRIGGMLIWASVLATSLFFFILAYFFPTETTVKLNFLSRNQTLLLLFTLVTASVVGLVDDLLVIYAKPGTFANGFSRKHMLSVVTVFGIIGGAWFFYKLGMTGVSIPFDGYLELGLWFIPCFVLVTLATFSSGVIDGIDGLAGGVMATIFGAYATIAYFQNQIDIAVFAAVVAGAILAFLWFNIPPARFYLGETGMLGLTMTLVVMAFLTDTVLLLPFLALPLTLTSLSSVIQIISKKYFGVKVFRIAPLHHHFEAMGWSRYKITMRYWVISVVFAIMGILLALIAH